MKVQLLYGYNGSCSTVEDPLGRYDDAVRDAKVQIDFEEIRRLQRRAAFVNSAVQALWTLMRTDRTVSMLVLNRVTVDGGFLCPSLEELLAGLEVRE